MVRDWVPNLTERYIVIPVPQEMRRSAMRALALAGGAVLSLLVSPGTRVAAAAGDVPAPMSVPARSWAVECGAREVDVIQHTHSYLRYRMHSVDERGDRVREEIETPDGGVARLVERDGRPLSAEEDAAERGRLQALLNSPSSFTHHIRNEQTNKDMGVQMLKLMPDAMVWSYAPGQPQIAGWHSADGEKLVVLDFVANPKWNPPTLAAEALTGLEGRIWIDPRARQIVRLEGRVVKPVNIGWGLVAHLYPGGTIALDQTSAGDERWIANHVVEQFVVRAMMLKTIRQKLTYDTSEYQAVPSMTYQQAIRMLLDTPSGGQQARSR
jgi:hypothetical protein